MDVENTLSDRQPTHGDFAERAECELAIAVAMADVRSMRELPPYIVSALSMFTVKMSRIVCGDPMEPDHWRDIAGYATLVLRELEGSE